MPEDVLKHVKKEFKRLARMGESSGEASMLRTWLEWMTELPWRFLLPEGNQHPGSKGHPGRRPLRPGEDQAPHPRVPGGAQAQPGGQEPDPVLRRAAGRGQDLARPVDRARHGPQVPARRAGRHARRGRDPRPPAHLHRRAAGQHHPGGQARRLALGRADAGRDRQAGRGRLPRRPVLGAARSARPGAERASSATTTWAWTSTCRA